MTGSREVKAVIREVAATDQGEASVLMTNGDAFFREVIQLSYYTSGNTTATIPQYVLLSPDQAGSTTAGYDLAAPNVGYPCVAGPASAAGVTFRNQHQVWPSHAKANLAARFLIPPGWLLVVNPLDADMDGAMVHSIVTCRAGWSS